MYIIYFRFLLFIRIIFLLFLVINIKVAKTDTSFLVFFGILIIIMAF